MTGKRIKIVLFIISTGVILWMTILSRHSSGVHAVELRLMWGFQEMLKGNPNWKLYATYWIENVLLFMPFGFLFPSNNKYIVLLFGIIFSFAIELVQLFACLGLCELDDIICNGLGSILGYLMFGFARSLLKKAKEKHSNKLT